MRDHSHRRCVQSYDRGQYFSPLKHGLDCLTTLNIFATDPWSSTNCACTNTRLHPLMQLLLQIVPQNITWLFDQPPESAMTTWLCLDPGHSSGHSACGSDPPPSHPWTLLQVAFCSVLFGGLPYLRPVCSSERVDSSSLALHTPRCDCMRGMAHKTSV